MTGNSLLRVAAVVLASLVFHGCASVHAGGNADAACSSPKSHGFDFWVGAWSIDQKILDGAGGYLELPAETAVSAAPRGCVLTEHWSGAVQFFWEGMTAPQKMWGFSVRAYDSRIDAWRIYWMDERTPEFSEPYVGGFNKEGDGFFYRDFETPQGKRRGRITFAREGDAVVNWSLAISSDGGATWTDLWLMRMTRRR